MKENPGRLKLNQFPLPRGSLDNLSISSDRTYCRPVNHGSYSSSVLLSPNLLNKLKKIPHRSKMSAPLPYVNLEKYDMGDVDTNHVHIPAASTSAPDGNSKMLAAGHRRSQSKGEESSKDFNGANKENKRISVSLPGSRENLRNITSSDWNINRKGDTSNEPIYMNTRCETPPPELPPKGPSLILKNKQKRVITPASRPPPPPRPPDRQSSLQKLDKQRSQYQSPRHGVNPVKSSVPSQEEDYFLMGNFEQEPTHTKLSFPESERFNESLAGRTVVSLPKRENVPSQLDQSGCYMEMTSQFKSEPFLECETFIDNSSLGAQKPRYVRSFSASGVTPNIQKKQSTNRPESVSVSAGNSPRETRREPPIREENYILMSTVCPKMPVIDHLKGLSLLTAKPEEREEIYINDIENRLALTREESYQDQVNVTTVDSVCEHEGKDSSSGDFPSEMPFDNLLDFTLPHDDVMSSKTTHVNTPTEKPEMDNASAKSGGFFSRLIRRNSNSKDRKSISHSHENLLSGSNEPSIKENIIVLEESSSSGENSRSQSQQDLVLNPKDRNRSSSFPNRASFIAMNNSNSSSSTGISILSQQSDLGATNSSLNSCGTVSTRASSNECQIEDNMHAECVLSDSEKNESLKGNYDSHSYFFMGSLENNKDQFELKAKDESVNHESRNDDEKSDFESDSSKSPSDKHGGKVFTVLNVQGGNMNSGTCKTDDEKLIELWHSTHSLNFDKSGKQSIAELKMKMTLPLEELSPDQKADAIARHISSLPPFVPPKMKNYPLKLSPVLEKTTPKKERPESLEIANGNVEEPAKVDSPVLSPSLMKQQARATLRITPPSEDENGKIWIPRSSVHLEGNT